MTHDAERGRGLTFDQTIFIKREDARCFVKTARGQSLPIAAPGDCVHLLYTLLWMLGINEFELDLGRVTRELFGPVVIFEILLVLVDHHC